MLLLQLENEIKNTLNQNLQETCTSGISCNLNATALCEDEDDSEYEERTNIIKREAPSNKIKSNKKKNINVEFEICAKVTNDKNQQINMKPLENIQKIPFLEGNNKVTVVNIQLKQSSIVCPIGFVPRKMRCGTYKGTEFAVLLQ